MTVDIGAVLFVLLAGSIVLGVKVFRFRQWERRGAKNRGRVPFEQIRARIERQRASEWPTASHLRREPVDMRSQYDVGVRVPPYVIKHLSSPAGCVKEEEAFISRRPSYEPTIRIPVGVS
jgi:hypothetical protein